MNSFFFLGKKEENFSLKKKEVFTLTSCSFQNFPINEIFFSTERFSYGYMVFRVLIRLILSYSFSLHYIILCYTFTYSFLKICHVSK